MKKLWGLTIIIIFAWMGVAAGSGINNGTPFAGTESTTGSAGSVKSPSTTGKTTFTGPAAGATRNVTTPDADWTAIWKSGAVTDGHIAGFDGTAGGLKDLGAPVVISGVGDGSAHVHLTAAQMATGVGCHYTNLGQTNADVDLLFPAAADSLECLFTVGTAQAGNHWGITSNTGDDIYLLAAAGTISQCGDQTSVIMTAAQVGQSFACWTFKTAANTYDWMCKAIAIGTSTFACHAAISAP